jgi:hypothetical protein
VSDTPKIGDSRPASVDARDLRIAELEARLAKATPPSELRAWAERTKQRNTELERAVAEQTDLRRQAALWRAGVRFDAGSALLLQALPDDVDLNDPDAVRQACAEIAAAVLGTRNQLVSP